MIVRSHKTYRVDALRRFLTYKALTFIGRMGKIQEIGGLSGWDKKWIFSFLVLTVCIELDKLGNLDKCDIVDALCR